MNPYFIENIRFDPTQTRYQAPFEYTFDPTVAKVAQLWSSGENELGYSSKKKIYYPVVPFNAQPSQNTSFVANFAITRLPQTDVLDVVNNQIHEPHGFGTVSVAHTISSLLSKMGTIRDAVYGENLGTCTLIAHNLVLVARHAVEGRNIQNLTVLFGYTQFNGHSYYSGHTSFECVIEEDALCDYAVIQLKKPLGERLGFVSLSIESYANNEAVLLHYPLGKPLKVSVHALVQTDYKANCLLAYHDSDCFSSGGAYFNPQGRMSAMHLGTELQLQGNTMNLLRYALPLERIVRQNPNSLLGKFALGALPQAFCYTSSASKTDLAPAVHSYLIDEEGRESEKILRDYLADKLVRDNKIKRNKGRIVFSKANLDYIAQNYPKLYDHFEEDCLGKTGLHKLTRLYSVQGLIESDHTIPYDVWNKSTKNSKMQAVVKGAGARPGENDMPAITIPYEVHRELLTTGSGNEQKKFRASLVKLCDADKVDKALIKCYNEYKSKGLNLAAYKDSINRSLNDYVNLGLIDKVQKTLIMAKIFIGN